MPKGEVRRRLTAWLQTTTTGRVVINAGWASAAVPVTIGLGVVQTAMLARMLGPKGYGMLALFDALAALFGAVLSISSSEAALVYVTRAQTGGDLREAGHMVTYCGTVDFVTACFAAVVLAATTLVAPKVVAVAEGTGHLLAFYALTLVFRSTYWTSYALLRVANRFSWTFYQAVARSVLKTSAVAALFLTHAGLSSVIWMLIGIALVDGLSLQILAILAMRRMDVDFTDMFQGWWRVPREVWRFQALGYSRAITKVLYGRMDVLMIGYLADPFSVGIFRSARQVTDLLSIPKQSLVTSLQPEFSRLWFGGSRHELKRLLVKASLALGLAFGAVVLLLVVGANVIIRLLFGTAFLSARGPLLILMISALLAMVTAPLNSFQIASGRAGPAALAGVATVVVQAALLLLLLPRYHLIGAAWARVGGLVASNAVMIPTGVKRLREGPEARGKNAEAVA